MEVTSWRIQQELRVSALLNIFAAEDKDIHKVREIVHCARYSYAGYVEITG